MRHRPVCSSSACPSFPCFSWMHPSHSPLGLQATLETLTLSLLSLPAISSRSCCSLTPATCKLPAWVTYAITSATGDQANVCTFVLGLSALVFTPEDRTTHSSPSLR